MTKELLNLTGKIDAQTTSLLKTIVDVTTEQKTKYIIVGATARDLVLHYGYNTPVQRATKDLDFAVEVESWEAFNNVRDALIQKGCTMDSLVQHRLYSENDWPIDIVPFGGVENTHASIKWPPDDNPEMDVRGFKEASDNAQDVLISDNPQLKIRVVTPEGLMLLKLIAWADRPTELRKKDADDVRYLLTNYLVTKNVQEDIYNDQHAAELEYYGWDPDLAACSLLGKECRKIAAPGTSAEILKLNESNSNENIERIADEMTNTQPEKNLKLLDAFMRGFDG